MNNYVKLGDVSKVLYIKSYEVNWDSPISISLKRIQFKYIIQYYNEHKVHPFNRTFRHIGKIIYKDIGHIKSVLPFINIII